MTYQFIDNVGIHHLAGIPSRNLTDHHYPIVEDRFLRFDFIS